MGSKLLELLIVRPCVYVALNNELEEIRDVEEVTYQTDKNQGTFLRKTIPSKLFRERVVKRPPFPELNSTSLHSAASSGNPP